MSSRSPCPVRTLVLTDAPGSGDRPLHELHRAGLAVTATRVGTRDELVAALAQGAWDLVLAAGTPPGVSVEAVSRLVRDADPDVPLVLIAGAGGEAAAAAALRAGASDYVPGGDLTRLAPAVERELRGAADRRALRASEARFRAVVEKSYDAVSLLAADGTLLYVSPGVERMAGRAPGEVVGQDAFGWSHPDDLAAYRPEYDAFLARPGAVITTEHRYRHRDGSWRWVEATSTNLLHDPAVGAVVCNFRDVTARKAAEAATARLAALVEAAGDAIISGDLDGTVRTWNPAAEQLFGYRAGEVVGRPVPGLVPADRRAEAVEAAARAARGEQVPAYETVRLRRDGAPVPVSVTVSPVPGAGLVAVYRDVTPQRAAEAAVRDREELLRSVIAHIPAGVFWKDRDSVLRGCNDRFARDHGFGAPAEVVGKTDRDLPVAPAEAARFAADDRRVMATGEAVHAEETQTRPDGRVVTLLTSKVPLRDAAGAVTGVLGVYQDVTDQKRLEEQYRQAVKMEAVGRLAGGVAHDFNNLLTAINGFADLALDELPPGHPVRGYIAEVRKAGDRAAGLTRQLLAFGRKSLIRLRAVDLNAVMADLGRMLARVLGEDVRLTTDPAPAVPPVRADPGEVEQVVMNLAINARDAMPGGGTLALRTRPAVVEADGVLAPGRYVVLEVTDTGCGMTDEVKARAFEPFFTTKPAGQGTGLGLATVYAIARATGGDVRVETAVGRGTTVRVYWPASAGSVPDPAPAPVEFRPRGGSEVVLLAEDECGVRDLAAAALRGYGYTVLAAGSADEAVAAAARAGGRVDVLVTDVVMPGGGGVELARRVRAAYPGVRVLFVSGHTDDAVLRHGIEQARVHFLPKPFTPRELAAKVREVLDRPAGG